MITPREKKFSHPNERERYFAFSLFFIFNLNCLLVNQTNIHPINDRLLSRTDKELLTGHSGSVFWLYGLSGSGKSTLAVEMEKSLHDRNIHSVILDGDNLRSGLNKDLGFSDEDRRENMRRVSEMAKVLSENGIISIVSMITPLREFRDLAKSVIGDTLFHEIFIKASFFRMPKKGCKGTLCKGSKGRGGCIYRKRIKFRRTD